MANQSTKPRRSKAKVQDDDVARSIGDDDDVDDDDDDDDADDDDDDEAMEGRMLRHVSADACMRVLGSLCEMHLLLLVRRQPGDEPLGIDARVRVANVDEVLMALEADEDDV